MPLKLLCGASRKVTDGNYGSRGANLHLEVELDPMLLADMPDVHERIRQLYDVIHEALAEEMAREETPPSLPPATSNAPRSLPESRPANRQRSTTGKPTSLPRRASPAQVKAIDRIAKEHGVDLQGVLQRRYRHDRPDELTLREASELIDALKAGNAEYAA